MTNPYAPPRAAVKDVRDPHATAVPADRGTRLGATMLDGVIFACLVYVPLFIAGFTAGYASSTGQTLGSYFAIGAVLTLAGFIVWAGFTIKYVRENGQSIAKRLLGIKVVRSDGSSISLGRIFWMRNFLNALISVIPLYGLVDALFIFGDSRQCLHDKLADTIVVKA
jgi:uncharacterized RDD family membrane protein YckC